MILIGKNIIAEKNIAFKLRISPFEEVRGIGNGGFVNHAARMDSFTTNTLTLDDAYLLFVCYF